jgi:hypothetical protein
MYVWKIEFEEKWDTDDYFSEGNESYTVAAKDYESALLKARKVALQKSFVDADEGGNDKTHKVVDVRLILIKRGDELDA